MNAANRPAVRIRSHWFRSERPKSTREIAGAAAFITWRIAQQVLKSMRKADFEIDAGPRYFDFVSEWLIFLVQVADRHIYPRMAEAQRFEFISALANRVGEILADNRHDLLDGEEADGSAAYKSAFIDLLNQRVDDYASFTGEDPVRDYAMLRYLADRVCHVVGPDDAIWVHDQVMEIEAPQAAELLQKGMRGLLGEEASARRGREVATGE